MAEVYGPLYHIRKERETKMSQPEEFDELHKGDGNGQVSDVYTTEGAEERYNTLNHTSDQQTCNSGMADDTMNKKENYSSYANRNYNGESCYNYYNSSNYNNGYYNNGSFGKQQGQSGDPYQNNIYGNSYQSYPYQKNPYGYQQARNDAPFQNGPYQNNSYGNHQGQNGAFYQNGSCQNNFYGNHQTQNGVPYQNNPYGNQQSWNGNPGQSNPYGYQQGQGRNPYNNYPYSPYSPYAAPAKKNNMPLIIGITAAVILLFLIAVAALTYRIVSLYSEGREKSRHSYEADEYDPGPFDQDNPGFWDGNEYDYFYDYGDDYFNDYDYGYSDDYDYGYDYDFDYDNDQYYTLHDDIKSDLSYSVDFDEYEYTEDEKVVIRVSYPVIDGKDVPNLKHLNDAVQEEVELFKDYLKEYEGYLDNEDSFFSAVSMGYVTYMDEEKLSIVFSENIYTDLYSNAYLYSINIDMENGVILENENMLSIDDDFSVEFRTKSDIQNGEIVYLTGMTDQQITDYFNSSNVIVFYTPKGMEIGFNYEAGWVTVTYEEYEKYLKVF